MNAIELLGYLGYVLVSGSYLPQVWKTWRTKKVDNISGKFLLMLWDGLLILELYLLYIGDAVMLIGNSVSVVLTTMLIVLYYKYVRCLNNVQRR